MNYQLVNLADKRLSIEVAAPKVLHYPNHAFTTRSFKRYEYLPPLEDTLWRIKTGIVRTMTWDEEGNQIVLGIWSTGDIVSSLMSLLDPYQIQCLSAVEVEIIPNILDRTFSAMLNHCQQTQELLSIVHCRTIDIKLKKILIWLSNKFGIPSDRGILIDIKLTHQDIAEVIGSTRVTITRSLNLLKLQGLLSWKNHYLTLHHDFSKSSLCL